MSQLPPYSVLMSVYAKDNPVYLDMAIASMAKQSIPFEDMVIVCDGPLSQSLEQVIHAWEEELNDRLYVHKLPSNGGLGAALAAGLPYCKCDIVARMDSDDISRGNRCELLLNAMVERNLDVVGGAIEEFDTVPGDMGAVRRLPEDQDDIREFATRRNPFNHVSVVYNRKTIEAAGSYESFHLLEDYWLWVRVLMNGGKCGNITDVVVDVRTGAGMYARRSNIEYLKSQIKFFFELKRIGFVTPSQAYRAIVERSVATILPNSLLKLIYNRLLRG